MWYKLVNKLPVKCSAEETNNMFRTQKNSVQQTKLKSGVYISTIFLGMNRAYRPPPLFFETMIFGGKYHHYCKRCTTYDEAVTGHRFAVRLARMGVVWGKKEAVE